MINKKYDVLIIGYYGFGNLGDELLACSVTGLLCSCGIKKERIAILSANTAETESSCGTDSYCRWSLPTVVKALRESRTLLLGGGGLFQDATSIRSVLYYWLIVKIASLCGLKVWSIGQSIGPLKSAKARRLTKSAFSAMVFCGVRDKKSLALLESWGIEGNIAPDCVMSLSVKRKECLRDALAVNIRPGYKECACKVFSAAAAYAKKNNLKIVGVALSEEDKSELELYSDSYGIRLEQITVVKNLSEFENITVRASAAFGMRLHFVILSILAGIPVCAGAYDPKVASLCSEMRIPEVSDFDINTDLTESRHKNKADGAADEIRALCSKGLKKALGE